MTSPFKLIDLPSGRWAVTWVDQLNTNESRLMPKGDRVLDIIFTEMRLFEARLGILLNGGELDILTIDAGAFHQSISRAVDFLSLYIVAGSIFDTETQAQQFLQIAEKYHIMNLLKEPA